MATPGLYFCVRFLQSTGIFCSCVPFMPFITYSCVDQYIGNCRCRSGTLSTLRFGERAKLMPNKPVINEISEDDVNGLSDQIRQLKVLPQNSKACRITYNLHRLANYLISCRMNS